jgi:hypothetical protein
LVDSLEGGFDITVMEASASQEASPQICIVDGGCGGLRKRTHRKRVTCNANRSYKASPIPAAVVSSRDGDFRRLISLNRFGTSSRMPGISKLYWVKLTESIPTQGGPRRASTFSRMPCALGSGVGEGLIQALPSEDAGHFVEDIGGSGSALDLSEGIG